jgi:hypothetical protein
MGKSDFEAWTRSLDMPDLSGEKAINLPAGLGDSLWQLFTERGTIGREEVEVALTDVQLRLAREAADLVARDLNRTASIDPVTFDVRYDAALETIVVSLNGSYQTPAIFALRSPESTAEVAGNLQDRIQDKLGAAWPTCPNHNRGVYAQIESGEAVWYCRSGGHSVSRIGDLNRSGR